jgi:hypothetical protein
MRTRDEILARIKELEFAIQRRQSDIETELDERIAMAMLHYIHRVEDRIEVLRWVLNENTEGV